MSATIYFPPGQSLPRFCVTRFRLGGFDHQLEEPVLAGRVLPAGNARNSGAGRKDRERARRRREEVPGDKPLRHADSRASLPRLVGIVRSAVWMDLDIVETLRLYGMASPPHRPRPHYIQQCLAGF